MIYREDDGPDLVFSPTAMAGPEPGMEVTEPTDHQFFWGGYYEGAPGCDHRSTVWPLQQQRIHEARRKAWGSAREQARYQECETQYVHGPHGFSR